MKGALIRSQRDVGFSGVAHHAFKSTPRVLRLGRLALFVLGRGLTSETALAEAETVRAEADPRAIEAAPEEVPSPAPARDDPERAAAELAELRAELAKQARAIAELQRSSQAQATAARAAPPVELKLSGYVQFDWVAYDQKSQPEVNFATGQPLNEQRFLLRRARVRAESSARTLLGGALELDANSLSGLQLRPINAEVWLASPWTDPDLPVLNLSAGLIKIPFGFEVPERETARPYLERSTVMRALFPGAYDLGLSLRTTYRFLSLTLAAMNGHPIGDRVFPALAPLASKELLARLQVQTQISPQLYVAVGASADAGSGFHAGSPTTKNQLTWRDDNGDGLVAATEVQVLPGSSATPSRRFERFALGGDAQLDVNWMPGAVTSLRAEVVTANNLDRAVELADPIGAGYQLREFGWYVGLAQQVTRWGLLALRYDSYDPDRDAREQRAGQALTIDRRYRSLALLAALRYDNARLTAQYDRNRNALGRANNGAPTNLKSDSFTLRAEVQF